MQRHIVPVTTNGSGAATVYTPVTSGRILAVHYVKTDFTDGVDFDVTVESTGQVLLDKDNVNATASFHPRVPVQDSTGVDASLDGTRLMREAVAVADDRVKIVVASGGAAKTGTFHVIVG